MLKILRQKLKKNYKKERGQTCFCLKGCALLCFQLILMIELMQNFCKTKYLPYFFK